MNLQHTSVIGLVILVLSLAGLIFLRSILAVEFIGGVVQIVAVLLMMWARVTFGLRSFHAAANPTEGGLVTNGPYRYIRHPIYAAILYFIWAGVLSHFSILTLLLGLLATLGAAIRIVAEERLVVEKYPEYAEYAERTKRIIPFVL